MTRPSEDPTIAALPTECRLSDHLFAEQQNDAANAAEIVIDRNATGLSAAAPRRLLHERLIASDGFIRDDGLWEVEARLLDRKTFDYVHPFRGPLSSGAAVHDMAVRLTVDDELTIVAIEASMTTVPMLECQDVRGRLNRLIGLRLGIGWRKEAGRRIGRTEGCTHLLDLVSTATTTLYQTRGMGKRPDGKHLVTEVSAQSERPFIVDGCHGWRSDGRAVRELFPQWQTPNKGGDGLT